MRAGFATLLLSAFLLTGCSHTKTVSVLGMKWGVGQHQDCIYKAANLYCIPASTKNIGAWRLSDVKDKDGKPVPPSEIIFAHSVELTYNFENVRSRAENEKDAETGAYDTKFSANPVDYSIWDCFKTGQGSPGISCALARKPSGRKDAQLIAEKEEGLRLDSMLKSLSMEELQAKCGNPNDSRSNSISRSLIYNASSGLPIAFEFNTSREPVLLDTAESQEKEEPDKARKIFWWKLYDPTFAGMRAAALVKEMPCLKK